MDACRSARGAATPSAADPGGGGRAAAGCWEAHDRLPHLARFTEENLCLLRSSN